VFGTSKKIKTGAKSSGEMVKRGVCRKKKRKVDGGKGSSRKEKKREE